MHNIGTSLWNPPPRQGRMVAWFCLPENDYCLFIAKVRANDICTNIIFKAYVDGYYSGSFELSTSVDHMPVLAWLAKGWHKIRFDQLKGCGGLSV